MHIYTYYDDDNNNKERITGYRMSIARVFRTSSLYLDTQKRIVLSSVFGILQQIVRFERMTILLYALHGARGQLQCFELP